MLVKRAVLEIRHKISRLQKQYNESDEAEKQAIYKEMNKLFTVIKELEKLEREVEEDDSER